ncbi:MAG: valine--tRNA ligase, partial [Crocinitomicaceae bacterium]|nr:valine--tRNA ligase [Crocinitomicaceae bacterium]
TGVLHMGHMLNNTIQDVLVRRARMLGKNACWVPGTDHASIATEAKVVQKLKAEGIKKTDLTRDEFLKHAFEWKDKHGGIILEQLKKLGASCDWERTHFTMDAEYSESVLDVFVDLFKKGKIYRGVRMVNWDPEALTAVSDEEVLYKEVNSRLFYVRYKVAGSDDEWLTIATTRPETILGDTAICVNPNDARYKHLHGKKALVPLINREIQIIADEYVDMEFGTGCLKVTPAHDINDYELGIKFNLETIDVFNENGTLNKNGLHYEGKDRFEVRKLIEKELDEKGYLVKTEDHINKVGFSERTNAVIEPKLSLQWFVSMKELAQPALDNVMNGNIQFHPDKFKNTYRHWMENVKDWCISRQLWWGHRIPAWYFGNGTNDYVVAKTAEEALILATERAGKTIELADLRQDEDVLDTWFSSWLWPISVFNGLTRPGNEEIKYYYPTNDLVTAPEIMFFWVARMVIAGYEYLGDLPFKNVYYTGIVRDKLGRKMSKSLGNSPDPIELIEKYGADGVRVGILISSPAGNDLPFDSSQCEQGRNFTNKIWNALKLTKMWESKTSSQVNTDHEFALLWFENRLSEVSVEVAEMMQQFRLSEALKTIYSLIWDDFCSWYLEWVKPGFEQSIHEEVYKKTIEFFSELMQLLHPFMPFITEEIYHQLTQREDDICIKQYSKKSAPDNKILQTGNLLKSVISGLRDVRNKQQLKPKETIQLFIQTEQLENYKSIENILAKQLNTSEIVFTNENISGSFTTVIDKDTFYIITERPVNMENQKVELLKELEHLQSFLLSVDKKLGNEKFVQNAKPDVLALELKKKADALDKIKVIEDRLNATN